MEETFLRVNQRVEILVDESGQAEEFPSRIEALERDAFVVAAPMWKGVPRRLAIGTPIEIAMVTPTAMYEFSTTVVGCADRPIPTLTLKYPNVVNRIQRRQYVRLDEVVPVRIGAPLHSEVMTVNVSGGGVLLSVKPVDEEASVGAEWALEIHLPGFDDPLQAVGRVLRVEPTQGTPSLRVALEFTQISEDTRKAIIQHVYRQQIRERELIG
jgi:c-di-GMP-binding flagellar brake protein YcgR